MNKKRPTPKGGTFCYYADKSIVVCQGLEDKLLYIINRHLIFFCYMYWLPATNQK